MLLFTCILTAQVELDERALLSVKNGISIKKDSVFMFNLRFRMQNRFGVISRSGDNLNVEDIDARIRRLRLRFDGYAVNRHWRYYIQLNFSRADQDLGGFGVPQIVRDAMGFYHFTENFYFGFGQTKLPGNRQRVISSGQQQFPDRSLANSAFTLDRDFGFFGYYSIPVGKALIHTKAAVTTGDGRGSDLGNNGLAYTGRIEWLPFGKFIDNGDYSEGDLEFEPKPKLSFGVSYSHNERSIRTGGQLGAVITDPVTTGTFIGDFILKYRGWAMQGEYFNRQSPNPATTDVVGESIYILTGQAYLLQASRMLTKRSELAFRYTSVFPEKRTVPVYPVEEELSLNHTYYINKHRIKFQTLIAYRYYSGIIDLSGPGRWTGMVQLEFGI